MRSRRAFRANGVYLLPPMNDGLQMLQMESAPGASGRRGQALAFAMAAVFGAWAGALDLRSDELAPYLLVVLGGTSLIAAIFPRHAWGASLLVAGCVPFAHLYAGLTSMVLPAGASMGSTILAFIPSFLGAAAGVLLRRVFAVLLAPAR